MGKNKLAKFADMKIYPHVFEPACSYNDEITFEMRGCWNSSFFHNENPIVLELGCGKGEYTVGLAKLYPNKNIIGIDIKGSRMWTGAKQSLEEGLCNVAFLRTKIEMIDHFFAPGEVSEIWLTFPDPQMKKSTKRLTSTTFLERYGRIMKSDGLIHLKTDSRFLYTYTCCCVEHNNLPVIFKTDDLYGCNCTDMILSIKTYYEQQWLLRGMSIKYICFNLTRSGELTEPEVEIELDDYRSFGREKRSILLTGK
jgi:tRNA (guanine-N7-)-methyltransferase